MRDTVKRIGPWFPFWVFAMLTAPAQANALLEKVLEDSPGRLILELEIPSPALIPVGAAAGSKVACDGCHGTGRAGGPDLPVYRFDVLSGSNPPAVTFRILESETRSLPEGLAPVPHMPNNLRYEYRPDPELYRQAANLAARILDVRYLRGAPVRGIETPLALWSDRAKTLTLIKRMQVQVDFPGVLARPASVKLLGTSRREVKNPVGGPYLYESLRPRPLAKQAASKAALGGHFIKIEIGDRAVDGFDEDRMYSVSFAELAKLAGAGLDGIPVEKLRLFTGPNDSLPRRMDSLPAVSGTLREIPIQVVDKDGNGTFDGEDSVRFFAHGTSLWKRLPDPISQIRYEFAADPYSFENGYFLDLSGAETGQRLTASVPGPMVGAPLTQAYFYLRAEKDLLTGGCDASFVKDEETGFEWHWHWKGPCKGQTDTTVTLSRTNLFSDQTATLPDYVRNQGEDSLFVGFYVFNSNSANLFTAWFNGGQTLEPYDSTGSPGTWMVWTAPLGSEKPTAFPLERLEWRGNEHRFEGYTVSYRRKFAFSGEPMWIFPPETGKTVSYQVEDGPGISCLRIEDGVATRWMTLDPQGIFTDSLALNANARYYLFRNTSPVPAGAMAAERLPAAGTAIRNLANGSIAAGGNRESDKLPEYLIITARPLLEQALALRDYRNSDKRALRLTTQVVLVEDIYREYSGGRMSVPAIRDFLRYAYEGWGDNAAAGKLKYVVLFGDGNYDFRNIRASQLKAPPPNLIPPHEFLTNDRLEGVASDDFYVMLKPGGGYLGGMLDLALGRVPVQTAAEAADYLKKTADYENPALAGAWRARVVLTADDNTQRGQENGSDIDPITQGHTTDTDRIGALIAAREKGITLDKVYLLDYPLNSAYHKPEAAQDLLTLINRGSLLVNYVGHGASNQWADEVLLQTNDAVSRMRNEGRTPMVNAFSCTVGRFESLTSEGMSEQFVKKRGVGAIAAISATRESYPVPNIALANAFYGRIFPPDSSGEVVAAGDALRESKNSSQTTDWLNDLKYQLLGEPVLLLRKPQLNVTLTQVMDTIQALDCNSIKGRIAGGSGSGMINLKIVAGSVHKTYDVERNTDQEVDKRGNILFERTFPYQDGKFETEYFIPKQISFGDSTAQVQVFAWDASLEMEGGNARQNLRIIGTARSACASDADGKGPSIRITGCQAKETAELDFPDRVKLSLPYCLQIYVRDDQGGVLSAEGPDEGTTLEIPGVIDPFHPLPGIDDLNLKSYQISLDKKTLRPGAHMLKVSARDGYGNISQRQLQMELTVDSSITAVTAYNFPNPMKRNGTTFHFATVMPAPDLEYGSQTAGLDRLEYEIRVFNQSGKLVRVFAPAFSGQTGWDGRDNWGNLLANGVYFYQVKARQLLTEFDGRPDYRTLSSKRNILVISR